MIDQTNDSAGESATSTPGQTANVIEVERSAKQQPGAMTLLTVADTVRRVRGADSASVVSFSLENGTITWRAMSGFRAHELGDEIVRPLRNVFERCAAGAELITLEGIGQRAELPAEDFPVLSTEGIRYAALAPLC